MRPQSIFNSTESTEQAVASVAIAVGASALRMGRRARRFRVIRSQIMPIILYAGCDTGGSTIVMENTAILDAALAYGASRWYRGVHHDPQWEFAGKYRSADDKLLFYEFIHNIVLYDNILLDRSSVGTVSNEILELFTKINTKAKRILLDPNRVIAPTKTLEPVVDSICRLLVDLNRIPQNTTAFTTLPIPWAYSTVTHNDRQAFAKAFNEWGVDPALLPFAIFVYRGICYSGFANNYSTVHDSPTVYLASPGRMKALAAVLSANEIKKINYPKQAYMDLVRLLNLPGNGYSFTEFTSLPSFYLSSLAQQLYDKTPREALDYVVKLRQSGEAVTLRKSWSERVWERSKSAAIGPTYSQSISDSNITGDVTLVIHASADS